MKSRHSLKSTKQQRTNRNAKKRFETVKLVKTAWMTLRTAPYILILYFCVLEEMIHFSIWREFDRLAIPVKARLFYHLV